ncbi:DUF7006 family protein [Enterococcus sp. DIV0876]|uniref:DUF7006 family protein n=1 Tax=Enterococcus sp. DIV0876 TaxID=2774633 RepID=UPI003D2FDB25
MDLNDIKDIDEYLYHFEEKLALRFFDERPYITSYYHSLKEEMSGIAYKNEIPFIERMRTLLKLDAKLQILHDLTRLQTEVTDGFDLSEHELIEIVENDSNTYYRETLGKRTSDSVPWKLSCLGDQD